MKRALRDNGLTVFFLGIFLATLVAQAVVGHSDYNHQEIAHNAPTLSLARYVTSSAFWTDVMENWQSEYLQFTLYIVATVWLLQRGSSESKEPGDEGRESDEDEKIGEYATRESPRWARGGFVTALYSNSLFIVMVLVWLGSWSAQAVTGHIAYNADQLDHQEAAISLLQYIGTSDFWDRTLQNWQSEFLAVGSMAALSIYLRQRGSPESKPVGASHEATGA
jgi:hypothetical protein